ncbi:capsid assembly protein [Arenibaculum sp.]|jgi:hypothetical protein|uniref:capsid assembly protein n=1 Tax=Arenibaculum sp. TaxID=2865862 RepID=UPI002E14C063|nr:hypothetical protein [Arenibaculum sp.]
MTDPNASPPDAPPVQVPERFLDPETGAVRVDALLAAYLELEARQPDGDDRTALLRRLGVPDTAESYCVDCSHGLFEPDTEINGRLHAAGFTPEQVQLVYDLAAERLVPTIGEIATEMAAERDLQRLVDHFGGDEGWRENSRQILAWARRNLPPDAVESLSGSYEGVLALHRLMTAGEPAALRPETSASGETEGDLQRMMRDPRYWRDRDSGFVAKVTDGFRRLYGERG